MREKPFQDPVVSIVTLRLPLRYSKDVNRGKPRLRVCYLSYGASDHSVMHVWCTFARRLQAARRGNKLTGHEFGAVVAQMMIIPIENDSFRAQKGVTVPDLEPW